MHMDCFEKAFLRFPGPDFAEGITTSTLGGNEYDLILKQHQEYLNTLRSLGLETTILPSLPGYPDAHFIEDVAIFTPQIKILTRPGALPRREEADFLAHHLETRGPFQRILAPGTLDGGDVLFVEKRCYIGLSDRTNTEGAQQLINFLTPLGYTSETLPVGAGLHLKSSVNYLGSGTVLVTADWVNHPAFSDYHQIVVPEEEAYAANTLWVNEHLLMPAGFPRTRALLAYLRLPIIELDMSEARKMDGGLTCWSLRI